MNRGALKDLANVSSKMDALKHFSKDQLPDENKAGAGEEETDSLIPISRRAQV